MRNMKKYQKPYTEYFEIVGKTLMTFDLSDGIEPGKTGFEEEGEAPARKLYL